MQNTNVSLLNIVQWFSIVLKIAFHSDYWNKYNVAVNREILNKKLAFELRKYYVKYGILSICCLKVEKKAKEYNFNNGR